MSKEVVAIYYDLRGAPNTFDAAIYFATAASQLRLAGYTQFDAHIVAHEYRLVTERELTSPVVQKDWRLINIVAKLPLLIPGVLNIHLSRRRHVLLQKPMFPHNYDPNAAATFPYHLRHLIKGFEAGADVQVYSASAYAREWARQRLNGGKTLVLGLRSADYSESRDSPMAHCHALYEHLTRKGHQVLVIPDQYDVLVKREFLRFGWDTVPEAAIDLDLRLALYQEARATIHWASGSACTLWLSKSPFLIFAVYNSQHRVASKFHFDKEGRTIGEQYPFFGANQRFDWKDAPEVTAEHMISATDAYLEGNQWPAS